MANDAGNKLEYWLFLSIAHKAVIYKFRKWSNLKMAIDKDWIWIRGFTLADIESTSVLSIPSIKRYYLKGTHLVPYGKTLPAMIEPNLLWSPIYRGLKISLPKENFNYFGIDQTYKISLVPSEEIKPINATLIDLNILETYMHSASNIRLKNLQWTILNEDKALIIGTPILPIQGQDFYQYACFLLPAGWRLKYDNMASVYKEALGESIEFWYVVNENSQISKLRKTDFNQLSKGSFLKTLVEQRVEKREQR